MFPATPLRDPANLRVPSFQRITVLDLSCSPYVAERDQGKPDSSPDPASPVPSAAGSFRNRFDPFRCPAHVSNMDSPTFIVAVSGLSKKLVASAQLQLHIFVSPTRL